MYFLESQKKYTLFSGGLGSGKTFAGAVWAATMAINYPKYKGIITANTYSQLRKATLQEFFHVLNIMDIKYTFKVNSGEVVLDNGAIIYAKSMEKYDDLRGINAGWGWSDEVSFSKEEAFQVLIGRIRVKGAPNQWKGTTTPNGFNWLYKRFVKDPAESSIVITSSTLDNSVNLDEDYIRSLRSQYDSRLAQQEIDGAFVNLNAGLVYYEFDRRKHLKQLDNLHFDDIYYIGLDFNVHPLTGVFVIKRNDVYYVVDELYLENSNTFHASKELVNRYSGHRKLIIADSTGDRRRSSANMTDHEILRRAGLEVAKFTNPSVKDRYNNMNRLFISNKLFISPKLSYIMDDLEQLTYETKDPMLSHISDALGYALWYLEPLKKPKRETKQRYY